MDTDSDRLITAAQAAEIMDRAVSTVHRYHEIGRLPSAAKLPGLTGAKLFDRKVVEEFAKELAAAS